MYQPDPFDLYQDMLQLYHVRLNLFQPPYDNASRLDYGLRNKMYSNYNYASMIDNIRSSLHGSQVSMLRDSFGIFYMAFSLADGPVHTPYEFAVVGPYVYKPIPDTTIHRIMKERKIPAHLISNITVALGRVPLIKDRETWSTMNSFFIGRLIHEDGQSAVLVPYTCELINPEHDCYLPPADTFSQNYHSASLAGGFQTEYDMLAAVRKGHASQANRLAYQYVNFQIQYHQQFGISQLTVATELNTLLRYTALLEGASALQLDNLFVKYTRLIENLRQRQSSHIPFSDMIIDYCDLISRYSHRNYSPPVRKCLDYIDYHYAENITLSHLAAQNSISCAYLSTLFSKEMGMSLIDYLNQTRIQHAKMLLENTVLSIQEIGLQCGFNDSSYFTRIFKKITGHTPKQFRNQSYLI